MGQIPVFTRYVPQDNATGGAAIEVARAQSDINAEHIGQNRHLSNQIENQLSDFAIKQAAAKNATWVNEQAVAFKKQALDLQQQGQIDRAAHPDGFHKDFDKQLSDLSQTYLQGAPSQVAQQAMKATIGETQLGLYDDNQRWEKGRSVEMYGESMDRTADNMNTLAMQAGQKGQALVDTGLLADVHASAIAGSTFIAPEKVDHVRRTMMQGVAANYLNGLADAHPQAALKALESPEIKDAFSDPEQYMAAKKAIENRVINVQKVNGEKEVLGVLKNENGILAQSLNSPMSYADLQHEFEKTPDMSTAAKSYFLKANGFSTESEGKLTDAQKMQAKAALYTQLSRFTAGQDSFDITNAITGTQKMDLTSKEGAAAVAQFQDTVYQAMNSNAITSQEGMDILSQVVQPMADQKAKALDNYSSNQMFGTDIGLGGLDKIFKGQFAVPVPEVDDKKVETKYLNEQAVTTNSANKVKLYDYYMSALAANAKSYNIKIGDVPQLPNVQKRKIYTDAQNDAVRLFMLDRHPSLSTLRDIPNQIFSDGKLIQGMAGDRNIKPDVSAKGTFQILTKDGHKARRYQDGTIEVLE